MSPKRESSQPLHHSISVAPTPQRSTADDDSAAVAIGDPSGASARRRRGRPPGSKNRAKPIAAAAPDPALSLFILEIPGGRDIFKAISRFCHEMNRALCILHARGSVADVTLRHRPPSPVALVTLRGQFDIVSIAATFLPQATPFSIPNGFTVNLAGPEGQIYGGCITEGLIGVGSVYVTAASFNEPSYHLLPSGDDDEDQSPPIPGETAADS